MSREHRSLPALLAVLGTAVAVALLAMAGMVSVGSSAWPAAGADPGDETNAPTALEVTDAQLRWGVNNESNNRAFAPGTYNFLSAGKVGNPGEGGQTMAGPGTWSNGKAAGWSASSGNVEIEKYLDATRTYAPATWAGLRTGPDGQSLPGAAAGVYSGHQVVLSGGTGALDTTTGDGRIAWEGSFTVVYYSGMSFFYVSDPVLNLENGVATVTATLGGYASSMDDMTQWAPVSSKQVTLADLGRIDLSAELGFTATPAYRGVRVQGTEPAQVRSGAHWGSFPQSFVDYQVGAGTGAYWYSSGGSSDRAKPALPMTVSYDAGDPVTPGGPADPTEEPTSDPTEGPAEDPTGEPTSVPGGGVEITDAQLRWGLNNESNNRAFAPGTYNFLSAGRLGDPGEGGQMLSDADTWPNGRAAGWSASSGNVEIEKYLDSSAAYQPATWAGLSTGTDGKALPSATAGGYSGHQVVLSGGTGALDTTTGDGRIAWKGSFTVAYYSGMSFFYVTDPVLTATAGRVKITATLGGYGSSMDDQSKWEPVSATRVTLADLGHVDLSTELGFTRTPAYRGVKVSVPSPGQVRTGKHWGAFPQSFVDYQRRAGTGSYWYSSGGSSDKAKPALPMTVSYDASSPVPPPSPQDPTEDAPDPISNDPVLPPGETDDPSEATSTPAPTSPGGAAQPAGNTAPVAAGGTTVMGAMPLGTVLPVASVEPDGGLPPWPWWAGGAALLGTAGLLISTFGPGRRTP
ncbi:hypothetical protein [Nocardioides insulae]|uniref:hypothetical protein n=1 Tax=Nocardioides insulae TaxID=394734 RepID=UPI0004043F13|nr:hypothetical protein [Nocardioides insulae]